MINTKKYRYKPVYKKFINLKTNVQNSQKLFKFKKKKWVNLLFKLNKSSKFQKRNCYYKFYDQNCYLISKYSNFIIKNYKKEILTKKTFNLFYSSLNQNYLKKIIKTSVRNSNQVKNRLNVKKFVIDILEKRLDVILYRSHFVLSIRNARQLIKHKHVLINEKIITDSSVSVIKGDSISFSKKSHKIIKYYLTLSNLWPLPPAYLQVNYRLFQLQLIDDIIFYNTLSENTLWLNLNTVINSYTK